VPRASKVAIGRKGAFTCPSSLMPAAEITDQPTRVNTRGVFPSNDERTPTICVCITDNEVVSSVNRGHTRSLGILALGGGREFPSAPYPR
jgi:hypothetical protein